MSASLAWQYAIVAVLVAASAFSVLRKYLPSVWGRVLARTADLLESARLPGVLRRRGAALRARIPASVGGACASSGGCSSCGACGTAGSDPKPAALPLAEPRPLRRH
ncbi:MAG: hypothetical protein BGP24_18680 [Lysobacterales bacterium 69-70]|nr:MAG: hypothetical protein ABS97_18895 [Xanthomonadaceae bacterium SCN 69-320]ODV16167.1 MAG: hypothetical protein ABT27_20670 [Xanthomonadaceae bacterium SCN 69-25]OJY98933.1 MAG: hypothetical protein BGP24_18680 [Xanthomonadales bacterium 69-70]